MTTVANSPNKTEGHWYKPNGEPCYTMPKKDGTGDRPTTLADARKLGLLPSVTTILKVLHKQGLVDWLCEQTALAVLTTARNEGEELDAFVYRVLHSERVQDQEAQAARDRGTDIHNAMEVLFQGQDHLVSAELLPWVKPAFEATKILGELVCTEKAMAGEGYAGKIDLVQKTPDCWLITDFKSTKKLPQKGCWDEHALQLSAYAAMWQRTLKPADGMTTAIRVQNVYISTVEQGKFVIWEHQDWQRTFNQGFYPLLQHWVWSTGYDVFNAGIAKA